jgi:DNA repair protein RecO (recombination protein O)
MIAGTKGIVLRAIKYGETSLVVTLFTSQFGIQTYMVKGVRSSRSRQNRAAAFQPGTLLDMVVYRQPQKNMQHLREFQPAYIYATLQENVIKNSVLLFSVELLLRTLPENAPLQGLFDFAWEYFIALDKIPVSKTANLPLFFIIQCSRELGYELAGSYSAETPYANIHEGSFAEHPPAMPPYLNDEDAAVLSRLLRVSDYNELDQVEMNSEMRLRLLDWYIAFLQLHTQHTGNIRSLTVLRSVLHDA